MNNNEREAKIIQIFLSYVLLCEVLALTRTLFSPSDVENQFLLGFSINRWLMILFVFFCIIGTLLLLHLSLFRKSIFQSIVDSLKPSAERISPFLLLLAILWGIILALSFTSIVENHYFISRLRPVLVMLFLITAGSTIGDIWIYHHKPFQKITNSIKFVYSWLSKLIEWLSTWIVQSAKGYWFLCYVPVFVIPLLFYVAIEYPFPSGFAGLYTLMAEKIAESHFSLPLVIPFYGPGGIPFAYPPVGLYLMAIATSVLGISEFDYLRFAPPFFMLLATIPISLIAFKYTKSRLAAVITPVIVVGAQRIFMIQGTSGGIVRGLAFLFAILSIYFYLLGIQHKKKIFTILSGVWFGLTTLTHLGYTEFVALFFAAYLLTHLFSKRVWLTTLIAGGVSICLIAPWLVVIIQRYGISVLAGAFQSHGNDYFVLIWQDFQKLIPWIENSLRPLFRMQFIWGMTIIGLIYSLFKGYKELLVWFALLLFFTSEGDRYLITVGAFLVGFVIEAVAFRIFSSEMVLKKNWPKIGFSLILLSIFFCYGWTSIISENQPVINRSSMDISEHIKANTPKESTYIIVAEADEAEWFPFLLERTPAIASWGGEWIGTYQEQMGLLFEVIHCKEVQSAFCLEDVIIQLPDMPNYLITHTNDTELNKGLIAQKFWIENYRNDQYVVWNRLSQ